METPILFKQKHDCTYNDIIVACNSYPTMSQACESLNLPYKTFVRIAKKLECYKPNQGGKGLPGNHKRKDSIDLVDVLEGKHPQYQSSKIRIRLIKEGIKEAKCEICGLIEWNGLPAPLELDHIDGNNSNHVLDNLRIICPNCHHQTSTHSCKKRN